MTFIKYKNQWYNYKTYVETLWALNDYLIFSVLKKTEKNLFDDKGTPKINAKLKHGTLKLFF